jgi:hypothetical protein
MYVCRFPTPRLAIEQGVQLQPSGPQATSAPAGDHDSGDERDNITDLCADGPGEDISARVWLRLGFITLWESDRRVLTRDNDWLNDNHLLGGLRHIEAAVPGMGESQPPSMSAAHASARNSYRPSAPNCSTAIHGGTSDHWTLGSTIPDPATPFAPLYCDAFKAFIPASVRASLLRLYGGSTKTIRLRRLNPWAQEDSFSCGHRVLGWAYMLAHGASPESVSDAFFDVPQMAAWVKRLLEQGSSAGPPPVLVVVPEGVARINPLYDVAWWWVTVTKDRCVSDPPLAQT